MIVKIRDTREGRLHKKRFLFDSYLYRIYMSFAKLCDFEVFSFGLLLTFCKNFNRMEGNKKKVQREAKEELEQSIHMVKAPSAVQPEKIQVKVSQQQQENPLMEE